MIAHHAPVGRVPPRGATPPGRKKSAQGKERSAPALGHESQNTSSPEGAKEGRWPVVPLSEVVAVNPRPGKDEVPDDSLASFIPMKCVEEESGRFEPLGDRKVAEVRKGYTPFRDGDVLFAKVTPCMENGKAAVMKGLTNGIGFGSTEFFTLRPKDRLDANYLFHFVLQSSFRRQAARNMTGAVGLRRVPKSYLEQQPIPLPPLPDQRRIVAEIEKQFTRLEAGVAALRRVQANLKRYRAAVLKAACEGKLDSVEVPASRLADLRLADVCESITDGDHQPPPKRPQGIPLLTIGNISSGKLDFSDTRFVPEEYYRQIKPNRIPRPDEILYSVVGATIGIPVLVNTDQLFCFSRHIALLKPSPKVLPRFLWLLMASPQTLREAWKRTTGSAQPTLALKPLRDLPVKLPPLLEQTQIVAEVERRLSVVEELEAVVSANLQRATRLRQSILQIAFTGKLTTKTSN